MKKCMGCGQLREENDMSKMTFFIKEVTKTAYFCLDKYHCSIVGIDKIRDVQEE